MAKVVKEEHPNGYVTYRFYCPGCKHNHAYYTAGGSVIWKFNGDVNNPTFSPSLLNTWTPHPSSGRSKKVCHLFVRNGKIEYCSDCTHGYAGKTIDMREEEST